MRFKEDAMANTGSPSDDMVEVPIDLIMAIMERLRRDAPDSDSARLADDLASWAGYEDC